MRGDTVTKERSRSQSPLEAPYSDHIHHFKRSKRSSPSARRRSSKLTMLNINIDALPDDVLVEILCRLPCNKLVFQCKCVSKRWCTLISNPYLIGRFLRLQIDKQTPIKHTLINPKGVEILTRFLCPVFERLMTVHGLKEQPLVLGTYNDLVLCCATDYYQRDYYICNPYTAQWVALPPTPTIWEASVPVGFICDIPYCSYKEDDWKGYTIRVNADYKCKVVRILPPHPFEDNLKYESCKLKVEIFSFETGEWRESVVSSPLRFTWIDHTLSFAYNGMLYWFAEDQSNRFLGLDPFMINNINSSSTSSSNGDGVTDYYKFHIVKFNDPAIAGEDGTISTVASFGVCGDFVRMADIRLWCNYSLSVHNLKEEQDDHDQMVVDGASKFCLKHTRVYPLDPNMFPDDDDDDMDLVVELIAFDPNYEDILYLNIDGDVVVCNIRTRKWFKLPAGKTRLNTNCRFFSFVLPLWPTPVPRLPQHAHGGGISS